MDQKLIEELGKWTVDFSSAVRKIKEGSEIEGSAITLNQDECRALTTGLQVAFNVKERRS
jgi:hypothetical protein